MNVLDDFTAAAAASNAAVSVVFSLLIVAMVAVGLLLKLMK